MGLIALFFLLMLLLWVGFEALANRMDVVMVMAGTFAATA